MTGKMSEQPQRLAALRTRLEQAAIGALLIVNGTNRRYVTGFTGSAGWVLVLPGDVFLITDGRYTEQAKAQAPACTVVQSGSDGMVPVLQQLLERQHVRELHVEGESLSYLEFQKLAEKLAPVTVQAVESPVPGLRLIKDETELAVLREAEALGDAAFAHIIDFIRPGLTETEVAAEIEAFMRRRGASDRSFETIVASGPRSALPHGVASDRVLQPGDLITLDFGCVYKGYCSDMTRTVALGNVDPKLREIYDIVLRAQEAAVAALRPGITGAAVDAVARQIIADAGYGQYFTHGTGHGVGLEIHEGPRLSATGNVSLEAGMIVTIEPGIYIPGLGGVRIEDMAVITPDGYELLSHSPKQFLTIPA